MDWNASNDQQQHFQWRKFLFFLNNGCIRKLIIASSTTTVNDNRQSMMIYGFIYGFSLFERLIFA